MAIRIALGKFTRTAALLAGLGALLVGCTQASVPAADGAASQVVAAPAAEAPSDNPAPAASGAAQEVKVELTEWSINLSSPTVKAGLVRLVMANVGNAPHAIAIAGNGVDRRSSNLTGGQSETLEVDLKPGTYEIWCPVGSHKDRGMVAQLTVE